MTRCPRDRGPVQRRGAAARGGAPPSPPRARRRARARGRRGRAGTAAAPRSVPPAARAGAASARGAPPRGLGPGPGAVARSPRPHRTRPAHVERQQLAERGDGQIPESPALERQPSSMPNRSSPTPSSRSPRSARRRAGGACLSPRPGQALELDGVDLNSAASSATASPSILRAGGSTGARAKAQHVQLLAQARAGLRLRPVAPEQPHELGHAAASDPAPGPGRRAAIGSSASGAQRRRQRRAGDRSRRAGRSGAMTSAAVSPRGHVAAVVQSAAVRCGSNAFLTVTPNGTMDLSRQIPDGPFTPSSYPDALEPGFPIWIRPTRPKAAETLAKPRIPAFTRRVRQDSATRSGVKLWPTSGNWCTRLLGRQSIWGIRVEEAMVRTHPCSCR